MSLPRKDRFDFALGEGGGDDSSEDQVWSQICSKIAHVYRQQATERTRFRRYKLEEENLAGGGAPTKNKKKKEKDGEDWE